MSEKVTYEQVTEARQKFKDSRIEYQRKYREFLDSVLEEAGFKNKLVYVHSLEMKGQFLVCDESSDLRPWEIKFHPLTRSGEVSMKSRYVRDFCSWNEDTLVEQLLKVAEVVGDLP